MTRRATSAPWHARQLAIAGVAIGAIGCARAGPAGSLRQHRCTCSYVTDFDAPGGVGVQVCAGPLDRLRVAESCAATSGVGAVSDCRCEATEQSCAGQPACALLDDSAGSDR